MTVFRAATLRTFFAFHFAFHAGAKELNLNTDNLTLVTPEELFLEIKIQ